MIECKQFCFHDCEEGEEWRNNLETLEMGAGEREQKTLQENRHPSLKKYIFYSPNLWRKAHFILFFSQKMGERNTFVIFCFYKAKNIFKTLWYIVFW